MKKLFVILISFGLLMAVSSSMLIAQTISVNGTTSSRMLNLVHTPEGIQATFQDTWTGDLAGHGHTHIFSSTPVDPQTGESEATARTWLVTPQGNLIFDGAGTSIGPFLTLVQTVKQGTGIYKNATGQLIATGMIGPNGVESTYSGTITLNP